MLDIEFDDAFSIRRLAGGRDGHGMPTYKTIVEVDTNGDDTDVPIYIECYVDRRSRVSRSLQQSGKTVDATMYYNATDETVRARETDLLVLKKSGETFRVENIHEQTSIGDGSVYAVVGLTRVKTPIAPNSTPPDEV